MATIIVDRSTPVIFDKKITDTYGDFVVTPQKIPAWFSHPESFTLSDIHFVGLSKMLSGADFTDELIKNGHIPLDAYCARALRTVDHSLLRELWWKELGSLGSIRRGNKLNLLLFFGSLAIQPGYNVAHDIAFDYSKVDRYTEPTFQPFESPDYCSPGRDWAVVFTNQFVRKQAMK